jgi:hypothetical protein
VSVTPVGAPGVHDGVAVADDDALPVPTELIALTRKSYAVPLVSPLTDVDVAELTPSANVVHVPDGLVRYSTR